jgi:glutamate/aspartate transport system substrate-binding protein
LPLPPNDPVFKRLVDDALRELFASGDMRRIYERWFLSELPGKGVNLQLPMAPSLQKVIQTPTDSSDPTRYR